MGNDCDPRLLADMDGRDVVGNDDRFVVVHDVGLSVVVHDDLLSVVVHVDRLLHGPVLHAAVRRLPKRLLLRLRFAAVDAPHDFAWR